MISYRGKGLGEATLGRKGCSTILRGNSGFLSCIFSISKVIDPTGVSSSSAMERLPVEILWDILSYLIGSVIILRDDRGIVTEVQSLHQMTMRGRRKDHPFFQLAMVSRSFRDLIERYTKQLISTYLLSISALLEAGLPLNRNHETLTYRAIWVEAVTKGCAYCWRPGSGLYDSDVIVCHPCQDCMHGRYTEGEDCVRLPPLHPDLARLKLFRCKCGLRLDNYKRLSSHIAGERKKESGRYW